MMWKTLPFLILPSVALADTSSSESGLSDTETAYAGAVMLQGEIDVSFDSISYGDRGEADHTTYAYFVGNTLYAGSEDDKGNTVDGIIEFFWFESSIDRGSDFYVTVIKTRATPNTEDRYYLLDKQEPVLSVVASTDIAAEVGGFRWDWSIPFENYGIDSYGEATLTTEYGLSSGAEGSVLAAETIDEDGVKADGTIQTKGYLNSEYRVKSQYQVTLYNWEMKVHGTPAQMEWDLWLETRHTKHESAYHEYFLVSQVKVDEPFVLTSLDISAGFEYFSINRFTGVAVEGITLIRPEWEDLSTEPGDDTGVLDTGETEDTGEETEDSGMDDTGMDDTGTEGGDDSTGCGCSGTPSPKSSWLAVALGGLLLRRRRQ